MTLQEIKDAVQAGKTVHCGCDGYIIHYDDIAGYLIMCEWNGFCIGLTHQDSVTMNGDPEEFYITGD